MSDGVITPGRHDGMAAFAWARGRYRLVRNHEINGPIPAFGSSRKAYDTMAGGGTTTLEVNRHASQVRSWVSCNGTQMNCAGGATPWGTWITCEETVNGPDVGPDNTLLERQHGYIFEVPVAWGPGEHRTPQPIRAAGRFAHEAVDVDPGSGILYMTEDNFGFPSGFYRYIPPKHPMKACRLLDGGKLQMLNVEGIENAELDHGQTPGVTYRVEWVTIDEPDTTFAAGTTNDQAIVFVGDQGRAKGAAIFSRLEGIFYDSGKVTSCPPRAATRPRASRRRRATATASASSGSMTPSGSGSRSCSYRYRGSLSDVAARLRADGDAATLVGSARIDSISIVAPPEFRAHVLGPDFFDAERHPEIRFRSTDVRLAARLPRAPTRISVPESTRTAALPPRDLL